MVDQSSFRSQRPLRCHGRSRTCSRSISGCALLGAAIAASVVRGEVAVADLGERIRITVDGELFTEYRTHGFRVPIFYPVNGPGGVEMMRHYPMRDDIAGEAKDHPHQRSLWYSHGNVNGVDFWADHERSGRIVHVETLHCGSAEGVVDFSTRNRWERPNGETVCHDTRRIRVSGDTESRSIDFEITIEADHGAVTMGDTKEGTMAMRTNPVLNLEGEGAAGHAVNSQGDADVAVWGKRAKWVDYWAPIGGRTVGVAVFDHPSNPRHPTWWHAREYGLIAANPFGIHDFEQRPERTGDFVIPAGHSAVFRTKFIFHEGDAQHAEVPQRYIDWFRSREP